MILKKPYTMQNSLALEPKIDNFNHKDEDFPIQIWVIWDIKIAAKIWYHHSNRYTYCSDCRVINDVFFG